MKRQRAAESIARRTRWLALALLAIMPAHGAWAQAGDDTIHDVMLFNVAPGEIAPGIALARQYRDSVRALAGNTGVTILQEIGRPNWIDIQEDWKDQSAHAAGEKSAALTALRDSLKSIGMPPFDRRDYKVVSVAQSQTAIGRDAIYMHLHLDVLPRGLEPTMAALTVVAEAARKGDGNLRYDVFQSAQKPTSHFTVLAAWRSRDAFDAYERSPYARQFRDIVGPLLGSPFDDRLKTTVD